jgi:hypothetical protein
MPPENRELTAGDPVAAALLNWINWAAFFSLAVAAPALVRGAAPAAEVAGGRDGSGRGRRRDRHLSGIGSGCLLAGLVTLSLCIGVAVLRYRLFDIDRVISRTLGYAIATGLLVRVYAGIVLLATEVLRFHHSTVAVAVATLAAAALFNSLRRRVQKIVDRRFNRAAMTPTGSSPRSRPDCKTRSTWTPCGPTWPAPSSGRWSPPTFRCGSRRPNGSDADQGELGDGAGHDGYRQLWPARH